MPASTGRRSSTGPYRSDYGRRVRFHDAPHRAPTVGRRSCVAFTVAFHRVRTRFGSSFTRTCCRDGAACAFLVPSGATGTGAPTRTTEWATCRTEPNEPRRPLPGGNMANTCASLRSWCNRSPVVRTLLVALNRMHIYRHTCTDHVRVENNNDDDRKQRARVQGVLVLLRLRSGGFGRRCTRDAVCCIHMCARSSIWWFARQRFGTQLDNCVTVNVV